MNEYVLSFIYNYIFKLLIVIENQDTQKTILNLGQKVRLCTKYINSKLIIIKVKKYKLIRQINLIWYQ